MELICPFFFTAGLKEKYPPNIVRYEHVPLSLTNIETAAASTTRGVRELVRADASQRRQRKRTCCLMMCVLVIILIIVLAIAIH